MSPRKKPAVPERKAQRISPMTTGAAVYRLTPPLEHGGELHHKVIIATKHGETQVFPVFGKPRVIASSIGTGVSAELRALGYQLVVSA